MTRIHSIVATLAAHKALRRTCPKCHTRQTVAADKRKTAIRCHKCGTSIPPPKS